MNLQRKKQKVLSRITLGVVLVAMVFSMISPVFADSSAPYVAFGADLTPSQKQTVMDALGVTDEDLKNDTTLTVTNTDEHQYLDGKVSSSLIGTQALSSCMVQEAASGSGIKVTTQNISYCTPSMYENALATAGMKDATVTVAGPYNISGTAALVGAMKAYSAMTGKTVDQSQVSTASQELATTGQVAKDTGEPDKTSELIAAVKSQTAGKNMDADDIGKAVDKTANQLNLNLSAGDRQQVINLMVNLSKLDLNANDLAGQAKRVYQNAVKDGLNLSKYGISATKLQEIGAQTPGLLRQFISWIKGLV